MPQRWTSGRAIALVELLCGLAGGGWLIAVGVAAEAQGAAGRSPLGRIVAVLDAAGVFAPRAPDPGQLREAVADAGGLTADAVLMAMHEADHHHHAFRIADHAGNLAFHDSHGEQLVDTREHQLADLVRLTGLDGVTADVDIGPVPTRIRLVAGGDERVLEYAGAWKYLSTELHVALARIARDRPAATRLAWLWSDQGVWLAGLRDVERLNADLGPAAGEGWEWVDEQPPIAAGEL